MLEDMGRKAPPVDALNSQIVQSVQFSNDEVTSYAAGQIATAPDMMIGQASGLVAQSVASYFDGLSKIALASQAILLKKMTENVAKQNIEAAGQDALAALLPDVLMGSATALAVATGALEADAASFAIDKIDQSIEKYSQALTQKKTTDAA